jgi:hypothetical protein
MGAACIGLDYIADLHDDEVQPARELEQTHGGQELF